MRESAFYANKEDALAGLWGVLEERGIFQNSQRTDPSGEVGLEGEEWRASDIENTADEDGVEDENYPSDDSESDFTLSGRRAEEITTAEIQDAILQALSKCPNHSCTLHSLTARVLKEVGVLTRGKPREAFEKRTMRCVSNLEKSGRVETYKAKNRRLRLVSQGTA